MALKTRKLLKTFLARGCAFLRVPETLSAIRRDVAILCYHRVIPREKIDSVFSTPWMIVSQDSFALQMRYLRRKYNVMALSAYLFSVKNGETIPRKSVIVTFDDGWEDNYLYAFPILKKYDIPAAIFLTTGFVGTKRIFWPERVLFALKHLEKGCSGKKLPKRLSGFFGENFHSRISEGDRQKWIEIMKRMDELERNTIIDELERISLEMSRGQIESNRLMTWEQARKMHENGIEFGSHGVTHRLLTSLNSAEALKEIQDSKKMLERNMGIQIVIFAYPNGNYNGKIIKILKNENYQLAVTVEHGLNTSKTALFRLKRMCMDEKTLSDYTGKYSQAVFSSYLSGLLG